MPKTVTITIHNVPDDVIAGWKNSIQSMSEVAPFIDVENIDIQYEDFYKKRIVQHHARLCAMQYHQISRKADMQ